MAAKMGAAGAAGAAETVGCMVHPNAVTQRNAGDYGIYSEVRLTTAAVSTCTPAGLVPASDLLPAWTPRDVALLLPHSLTPFTPSFPSLSSLPPPLPPSIPPSLPLPPSLSFPLSLPPSLPFPPPSLLPARACRDGRATRGVRRFPLPLPKRSIMRSRQS
jgi:hypothetical protein